MGFKQTNTGPHWLSLCGFKFVSFDFNRSQSVTDEWTIPIKISSFLKIRWEPNTQTFVTAPKQHFSYEFTQENKGRTFWCHWADCSNTCSTLCLNDPQFPPPILNKHLKDMRGKIIIYLTCAILSGLLKACAFSETTGRNGGVPCC